MATVKRYLEDRVCMYCGAYTFKRRPVGLWAYCEKWGKWAESDDNRPAPGLRTCEKFFESKEKA